MRCPYCCNEFPALEMSSSTAIALKTFRLKNGNMTQEKLASIIGVSRRQLIKWENEECLPSLQARRMMHEIGINHFSDPTLASIKNKFKCNQCDCEFIISITKKGKMAWEQKKT